MTKTKSKKKIISARDLVGRVNRKIAPDRIRTGYGSAGDYYRVTAKSWDKSRVGGLADVEKLARQLGALARDEAVDGSLLGFERSLRYYQREAAQLRSELWQCRQELHGVRAAQELFSSQVRGFIGAAPATSSTVKRADPERAGNVRLAA